MTAKVAIGWTTASDPEDVEAGDLSSVITEAGPVKIPSQSRNERLAVWHADSLGDMADLQIVGGAVSSLNTFSKAAALVKDGVPGKVRVSILRRVASLMSGEQYELTFS